MAQQPLTGPPSEDAGASTANHYRFQYCCAASRLLAAIAEERSCAVICEWHENYLILSDDGRIEAVSVKHQNRLPAWTLTSITSDDGKLGHLLQTFRRANGEIDCCFETNRAHRVDALFFEDQTACDAARDTLAARLSASRAEVDAFVTRLNIGPPVPDRRDIENAYADRYAVPAMDALGITGLTASRALKIARDVIAEASAERLSVEATTAVLTAAPADRPASEVAPFVVELR